MKNICQDSETGLKDYITERMSLLNKNNYFKTIKNMLVLQAKLIETTMMKYYCQGSELDKQKEKETKFFEGIFDQYLAENITAFGEYLGTRCAIDMGEIVKASMKQHQNTLNNLKRSEHAEFLLNNSEETIRKKITNSFIEIHKRIRTMLENRLTQEIIIKRSMTSKCDLVGDESAHLLEGSLNGKLAVATENAGTNCFFKLFKSFDDTTINKEIENISKEMANIVYTDRRTWEASIEKNFKKLKRVVPPIVSLFFKDEKNVKFGDPDDLHVYLLEILKSLN